MGFAVKRLQQTLRSRMDAALAPCGLTTPQYLVLALLADNPGISNSELADRSAVAAPTMLRILDALSRAGHITRADRSPQQRTRAIELTSSGERRLAVAAEHVQRFEDVLRAKVPPDHAAVILTWLSACTEALGGRPASPAPDLV